MVSKIIFHTMQGGHFLPLGRLILLGSYVLQEIVKNQGWI